MRDQICKALRQTQIRRHVITCPIIISLGCHVLCWAKADQMGQVCCEGHDKELVEALAECLDHGGCLIDGGYLKSQVIYIYLHLSPQEDYDFISTAT